MGQLTSAATRFPINVFVFFGTLFGMAEKETNWKPLWGFPLLRGKLVSKWAPHSSA